MRNFDYSSLKDLKLSMELASYLSQISEFKGKQILYLNQQPEVLNTLIEVAKAQSTESSNRIEGIMTTRPRMKELLENKTTPRNREEEEIIGYRDVLDLIHNQNEYIPITPSVILQLHRDLMKYTPYNYGGKFKVSDNQIVKTFANGMKETVFIPMSSFETPGAIKEICDEYNKAISEGIHPLIVIPVFINDFLNIHPFQDGNGRMARLLTVLLLYKNGYYVARYISLEKKIEDTKLSYYQALEKGNQIWNSNSSEYLPFIEYFFQVLLRSYRDFEERLSIVQSKKDSRQQIIEWINLKVGSFTRLDIQEALPNLGRSTIQKVMRELQTDGLIHRIGESRSAKYVKSDTWKDDLNI